jgi:hypothetical protein
MEFLQIIRRKPGLAPATFTLTAVGLVSSILATLMGIANAAGKSHRDLIETHRWAGVVTTVAVVGAMALVFKARSAQGGIVQAARASLFLSMILVSLTGHWGGALVYGEDYYWPTSTPGGPPLQMPSGRMDFVADIAPILKESCFVCHGGEKSGKNGKGGLRLTTKALAMKGGDGDRCIEPGDPAKSSFYMLLVEKDPDKRMPEKAPPLAREKIEKIRLWIEQGAVWPDSFEFKK